jgi:hypothetical protein
VCEEDVLDTPQLLQALGQHWVEAWGVNHHIAPRAHDEVRLTGNGVDAAPAGPKTNTAATSVASKTQPSPATCTSARAAAGTNLAARMPWLLPGTCWGVLITWLQCQAQTFQPLHLPAIGVYVACPWHWCWQAMMCCLEVLSCSLASVDREPATARQESHASAGLHHIIMACKTIVSPQCKHIRLTLQPRCQAVRCCIQYHGSSILAGWSFKAAGQP